jgi:TRAP-type C4-dicarboxylate transport system permease small subunit
MFMKFYDAYGRFLGVVGVIAGLATFTLMWLVDISVITRWFFNAPIPGSVEISQALLVLTITLGLAYAQSQGAHLRVTILVDRLPRRVRIWSYAVAALIGFGFFAVLTLSTFNFAMRSFNVNEYAWGAGVRFPLYPVKAAACVGILFLAIQFLLDAIRVGIVGVIKAHDGVERNGIAIGEADNV